MSRSIPPLLSPYLSLPSESSLILLTSVLGAGTNWLVLRYLSSLLSGSSPQSSADSGGDEKGDGNREVKVIFLSFMRDMAFWREGARKINLDLDRLTQQNRFHFIDGLSTLHLPPSTPNPHTHTHTTLQDPTLQTLSQTLSHAITTLTTSTSTSTPKPILLIDSPDLLLATSPSPTISPSLSSLLLTTRQTVHSTILTLSIDDPLLSPSPPSSSAPSSSSSQAPTPLSTQSSHFLLTQAHAATMILSTRLLDTGAARDVSGVLRITAGGVGTEDGAAVEERELLYFVGGDGGVRLFERGQ